MSNIQRAVSGDMASSTVTRSAHDGEMVKAGGSFFVECRDAEGNLKWTAEQHNLVVNVGLQDMNAKYFTGSGYTAAWFLGLYGAGVSNNPAAGDTMASHAGWTEVTAYSQPTRPAATFGTATTGNPSTVSNQLAPAVYTINANTVVGGVFLTSNSTKGGTTGILFSAADFQSPGDRTVGPGDTINVTYTFSMAAV
jgi:hypothetical protein